MNREEAKKILERIVNTSNELTHPVILNTEMEAIKVAIEALKAQVTLDDVSNAYENGYQQGKFEALQWIPVSDRLPDKDFADFLVQIGHGEYAIYETAYRVRGRWVFYSDRIDGEGQSVVAWMPLPSPYTEEEQ